MKDVQCYELFGGIALKNHAFSFFFLLTLILLRVMLVCFVLDVCLFIYYTRLFVSMITSSYWYMFVYFNHCFVSC